ncbi:hypothetical protein IGL98_001979 [Enterococcus sp. DIV0840]|uniref:hypothetical protein n=1 Tax=unclassified Enterococcus TaxID=2608891 RepID=UPI001F5D274C|nr:hypothetical protein [Enterococcus sp. DIV0849a]
MAIYSYEAQTIQGSIKKGRLRADSLYEAGQSLKKKDYVLRYLLNKKRRLLPKRFSCLPKSV